jgi:hypothetical protein
MAADNVNVIAFVRGLHNDAQGYSQTQRPHDQTTCARYNFNECDWASVKQSNPYETHIATQNVYFQLLVQIF